LQHQNTLAANDSQINADFNSPSLYFPDDYGFSITHPSINSYHQSFPDQSDPTVTGDQFVPIWASGNQGFQHQNVLAFNDHQINADFNSPSLASAYQWVPQSFNHITANGYNFNCTVNSPSLILDDETFLYPNAIVDGQFDATFQLPNFSSNIDFDGSDSSNNYTSISTTTSQLNDSASTDTQTTVTNFTKLPILAASNTAAATSTNVNTNRLTCDQPGCTTTFARADVLRRHKKMHDTPEHPCLVDNCDRKGDKAFYRLDKLQNHQRKKHRLSV
jgi:hypothetical protein